MNWKEWLKPKNALTIMDIIVLEIEEFNLSKERKWMVTGKKYYDVENDINDRVMTRYENGAEIEDDTKVNNKLAHAYMKNIVDEKVGYLLGKEFTYKTDDTKANKDYVERFKEVLTDGFQYELSHAAIEASNKGIAFWQIYLNEKGEFKYMLIPSEQCIPIWTDNTHTDMDAMIRYYTQTEYEGRDPVEVTKVEYHTAKTSEYFVLSDGKLIYDIDVEESAGPVGHYKKDKVWMSWNKVPFVAFKNNRGEFPDIKYVKSLIDDYDIRRSDISNMLDECLNYIYVIRNYGGQELGELVTDLKYYRAIAVEEGGGVDTLTPTIDIEAAKVHLEQTRREIGVSSQSVDMDVDKFGSSPSGIALKFLYSKLDLKCNNLEKEINKSFDNLEYFVDAFLIETGQGDNSSINIDIIFNRDIAINETDAVDNCQKSKGVISDRTIVANHPWVTDLDTEMEQIKKENEVADSYFDFDEDEDGDDGENKVVDANEEE